MSEPAKKGREQAVNDGATAKSPAPRKNLLVDHSALWTDQYALTMAQALHANDKHEQVTTFHGFIRSNPFEGGYLITAGQNILFEWLENWRFDEDDIDLLRGMTVPDPDTGEAKRLFTDAFLDMLKDSKLELTVDAMPEGEIAFPDEPIVRVTGPLWQCLLVETAMLNIVNSQSLFATLASRLAEVAEGAPILEFGLRRAQSLGGLEASRASYIGGVEATSNMLAAKYYGIPSAGTFAHALVMAYEDELEAFKDYAGAMPYNGIFLVDTYDTLNGVKKAIEACQDKGVKLKGIRLDSGDLAYLSIEARKILDDAGFADAKIAASNDLDEETIASLKQQGAKIDVWGVGTNLVTAKAQPALGAVYKLGAIYDAGMTPAEVEAYRDAARGGLKTADQINEKVRDVIKVSEQQVKTTIPGELDVLRYMKKDGGEWRFDGDTILPSLMQDPVGADTGAGGEYPLKLVSPIESVPKTDETLSRKFNAGTHVYRPIKPAFKDGKLVTEIEDAHKARARASENLKKLHPTHRRLVNPHTYMTGLERSLFEKRHKMIRKIRKEAKHG